MSCALFFCLYFVIIRESLGDLINRLIQDQRMEEIQMASTDPEKREQLYKEYGI